MHAYQSSVEEMRLLAFMYSSTPTPGGDSPTSSTGMRVASLSFTHSPSASNSSFFSFEMQNHLIHVYAGCVNL